MTSLGEMHVRPGHYIGVAPLPGGLTNACVVTPNPSERPMKDLLLSALRSDGQLRDRFAAARMVGEPVCLGPLAVDCDVAGMPGLLLAGDAGGLRRSHDRRRSAVRAPRWRARGARSACARSSTARADAHLRLLAARRREFAHKWRFNRGLRTMVAYPGALRAAGYGATVAPALLQRIIRYAGDLHAA